MNERIEHCLYQSGLTAQGCWDELDEYAKQGIEKFAELIIRDVIQEVENANIKHCCGTTYDLGVANCAQDKIAEHVKKQYNIKTIYGAFK